MGESGLQSSPEQLGLSRAAVFKDGVLAEDVYPNPNRGNVIRAQFSSQAEKSERTEQTDRLLFLPVG